MSTTQNPTIGSRDARDDIAESSREERLKRRIAAAYRSNRPKYLSSSMPMDSKTRAEKARQKFGSEHRSASVPLPSGTSAIDAFEDRLRAKLLDGAKSCPANLSSMTRDSEARVLTTKKSMVGAHVRLKLLESQEEDESAANNLSAKQQRSLEDCAMNGPSSSRETPGKTQRRRRSIDFAKSIGEALSSSLRPARRRERRNGDAAGSLPNSPPSLPTTENSAISARDARDDVAEPPPEERLKRRIAAAYRSRSAPPTGPSRPKDLSSSMPMNFKTRSEKMRYKLGSERQSASMPLPSDASAIDAFEDRLKAKLKLFDGTRSSDRPASLSPMTGDSEARVSEMKNSAVGARVRLKLLESQEKDESTASNLSAGQQHLLEDDSIERESSSGVSSICLDGLFADLQRLKEKNGNLTIPASHPSRSHIIDELASIGFEQRLRERWDFLFAETSAYKKEHGNCLIPAAHPMLGKWARVQRNHYKLYEQGLPSPLTESRFGYLKDIGFDEFVNWTRANEDGAHMAGATGKDGSDDAEKGSAIVSRILALDEKIAWKVSKNKAKLGLGSNLSSMDDVGVARKRMFQRAILMGRSSVSKRLLADGIESDYSKVFTEVNKNNDNDDKGASRCIKGFLEKYSDTARSCPSSNLRPGSWECQSYTYINKPAGLDPCALYKFCNEPCAPRAPGQNGIAKVKSLAEDDNQVNKSSDLSWRDLEDAVDLALSQSIVELNASVVESSAQKLQKNRNTM